MLDQQLQMRSGSPLRKPAPPATRPPDRIQAMQAAVATLAGESQRILEELRATTSGERHEVAELRAEVAALRQKVEWMDRLVGSLTRHLVQDASENLPPEAAEETAPPVSALPPNAVYSLLRAMSALRVDLAPLQAEVLDAPLQAVSSLHDRLEVEKQLEERAGALLELLRGRLLAGRARDELASAQDHLLYVILPDLLARVEELATRSDSDTRRALEEFRRHVLELVGLEEIAPLSGDAFDPARHNMLRAETDDGASGTVGRCYTRGLAMAATGQLVRKADVSVYP